MINFDIQWWWITPAQTLLNHSQRNLNLQQSEQICSRVGHLGQCTLPMFLSPVVAASSLRLGQGFATYPCKITVSVSLISQCQAAATSGMLSGDSTAVGTLSSFYRRWCRWGQALLPPHLVAEITLVVIRAVAVMWMRFKPGPRASMRFLCDYNKNLTHMVSY